MEVSSGGVRPGAVGLLLRELRSKNVVGSQPLMMMKVEFQSSVGLAGGGPGVACFGFEPVLGHSLAFDCLWVLLCGFGSSVQRWGMVVFLVMGFFVAFFSFKKSPPLVGLSLFF